MWSMQKVWKGFSDGGDSRDPTKKGNEGTIRSLHRVLAKHSKPSTRQTLRRELSSDTV
jgi:hypothetical protein